MDWYNKKENKESLYIPIGVKNRKEYFAGFGREELIKAIKASVVVMLAAVLAYIVTGIYLNAIMVLLTGMTVVIIMLTKSDINISTVDTIRFVYEFYHERQAYPYIYKNEFTAPEMEKKRCKK